MLGIPVVTETWLFRSNEKGHFIDIKETDDEFLLKYFSGMIFGIIGFDEKENNFIENTIKSQNGSVLLSVKDILDSCKNPQKEISFIIVK
jgi:hypothetical protein